MTIRRREFLELMAGAASAATLGAGLSLGGCDDGPSMHDDDPRRFLVLGFDGVDARLLEHWMDEGELPFLARLREEIHYRRLKTTSPPESPVAWSSFATGVNPGKHRVFDFLRRDPRSYMPMVSEVVKDPPRFFAGLIPTARPKVSMRRGGTTFWRTLADHGFRSTVLQVPVSFPPEELPGGQLLSGLSVPDLRGTQATFHYYATDLSQEEIEDTEMGGKLVRVELRDGRVETRILGPWDPVLRDRKRKARQKLSKATSDEQKRELRVRLAELELQPTLLELPLVLIPGPGELLIQLQGQEQTVAVGEWSGWFDVSFAITPLVKVRGICHFYVEQVEPELRVYFGPIEIDPRRPAIPISHPPDLSRELAEHTGLYKTRGWAIDTAALQDERIDEGTLWTDINAVMDMRERILFHMLDHHPWHFFIDVFSATDRVQHMYWRLTDPTSPRYEPALAEKWGDAILRIYRRMDRLAERVYERYVDERTTFFLMSDHGFQPFRRSVNLNTWLVQNGFMHLKGMERHDYTLEDYFTGAGFWHDIVWEKTKAYAMGLGQIYVNLKGREGRGCVAPGSEYDEVVRAIAAGLLKLRDEDGSTVALGAYRKDEIFSGPYMDEAPDIQLGFAPGYRVSWQTCLGGIPPKVIEDNDRKWSGDHCSFEAKVTPGVLFSNRPVPDDPSILDVAPTVLKSFGVPIPEDYDGRPLL